MKFKVLSFYVFSFIAVIFLFAACNNDPEISPALTVNFLGEGSGAVVLSTPDAGVADYRQDFTEPLTAGEIVELTTNPDDGSVFTGWDGDCNNGVGNATCEVVMDADKDVRAIFDRVGAESFDLGVTKTGNGTVTSTPAGIGCGTDCLETYPKDTVVTLSATPDTGTTFSGWSGDCTGTSTCTVTMSATRTVVAMFETLPVQTVTLSVVPLGAGNGTVTSDPPGILCGTECDSSFAASSPVTLTATAAPGSVFAGWRGCPSSSNVCSITPSTNHQVTAIFNEGGVTGKTILEPIRQGSDDAEQYLSEALHVPREKGDVPYEDFAANAVDIKSGDLDLTYNTDYVKVDQLVGLRFSDLSIPAGATILDARIQFTVDHPTGGYVKLYIYGQADPQAETFVHQAIGNISDRPRTNAFTVWEPPSWQSAEGTVNDRAALTPNLAQIVQEVVDLPGWQKRSNGLVFIIEGDAANGMNRRRAVSFEDSDTKAHLLVTYSN